MKTTLSWPKGILAVSAIFLIAMMLISFTPVLAEKAVTLYKADSSNAQVSAEEAVDLYEVNASDVGVSENDANSATSEDTTTQTVSGALIEIGNTTADETTVIIRTSEEGQTVDETVEVNPDTDITTDTGADSDLSDWIAGDQVTMTVEKGNNSGELTALKLRNRSFKRRHFGKNGWVKALRPDMNEMDVEWAGKIYTLNTENARMVAGLKNPAALADFHVNDRVRARVTDDGDGNNLTWNAEIIVVLRRGKTLFMRVTRWVVPAEITSIPDDTSLPYVISAKVLESKFYEKGDVNNLIGAPGTEINIQISDKTRLVRRYLGRANISEFMEGDHIRVIGRLNEDTGNLDAVVVKDNSIQALGVGRFISEVVSVDSSANKITVKPLGVKNPITKKRRRLASAGEWTMTLNEGAKIVKNGEKINLGDIVAGDLVRARGVVNRLNKTVAVRALSVVTDRLKKNVE